MGQRQEGVLTEHGDAGPIGLPAAPVAAQGCGRGSGPIHDRVHTDPVGQVPLDQPQPVPGDGVGADRPPAAVGPARGIDDQTAGVAGGRVDGGQHAGPLGRHRPLDDHGKARVAADPRAAGRARRRALGGPVRPGRPGRLTQRGPIGPLGPLRPAVEDPDQHGVVALDAGEALAGVHALGRRRGAHGHGHPAGLVIGGQLPVGVEDHPAHVPGEAGPPHGVPQATAQPLPCRRVGVGGRPPDQREERVAPAALGARPQVGRRRHHEPGGHGEAGARQLPEVGRRGAHPGDVAPPHVLEPDDVARRFDGARHVRQDRLPAHRSLLGPAAGPSA